MSRQAFFDMNGTLFDTSSLAEPLGGGDSDRELIAAALGDAVALAMVETITGGYRDFAELIADALRPRLRAAGKEPGLDPVLSALGAMQPYPEAAAAIAALESAGWAVGVLTNSSTAAAEKLLSDAGLGLSPVVGTDAVGAFKPDRRVYERALSVAGSPASETVLITAHWWDALGARRAGLRAGWTSRKEGERVAADPSPHYEGADLLAVAEAIASG